MREEPVSLPERAGTADDVSQKAFGEWRAIALLPSLDSRCAFNGELAAIVGCEHPHVQELFDADPHLKSFASQFTDQFGRQTWPALLLIKNDAPKSFVTAEAVTGFRDILAASVVPYSRAYSLSRGRHNGLDFSNCFQIYPWTLRSSNHEYLQLTNLGQWSGHLVSAFRGQTFPEQSRVTLRYMDFDRPLAVHLIARWRARFDEGAVPWSEVSLFRSLSMANEAAKLPAHTATTFYDVGRLLGLWVGAYEILAHPGPGRRDGGLKTVISLLEKAPWTHPRLIERTYRVRVDKGMRDVTIASAICREIFDRRNDFFHGNEVTEHQLLFNGRELLDFAPCLYRMMLAARFGFQEETSSPGPLDGREQRPFLRYQSVFEDAVTNGLPP